MIFSREAESFNLSIFERLHTYIEKVPVKFILYTIFDDFDICLKSAIWNMFELHFDLFCAVLEIAKTWFNSTSIYTVEFLKVNFGRKILCPLCRNVRPENPSDWTFLLVERHFCIFWTKKIPGVSNGIGDNIAFSTSRRLGFVTNWYSCDRIDICVSKYVQRFSVFIICMCRKVN